MSSSGFAARAVGALRQRLDPDQVLVSGPAYEERRRIWNGAVEHRPAVIVRCATPSDVQAAVYVARTHSLPLSVRGGGHDWAGRAVRHGGLVIDLSAMREVAVDAHWHRAGGRDCGRRDGRRRTVRAVCRHRHGRAGRHGGSDARRWLRSAKRSLRAGTGQPGRGHDRPPRWATGHRGRHPPARPFLGASGRRRQTSVR
jgi:FAD binding domain-containing protein